MARIPSTLTARTLIMGSAALALMALSASLGAQQPGHDQEPEARPANQAPRENAKAAPANNRPDNKPADAREPEQGRQQRPEAAAPKHDTAEREHPRQDPPKQQAQHDQPSTERPAAPRQQEAERRREQEQHWRQSTGPVREDVREVAHQDTRGRSFEVPTNDRVNIVTKPGGFDWAAQRAQQGQGGCPPGIARRYPDCAPPALSEPAANRWKLPGWYGNYSRDAGYRYTDGYLLHLGPDSAVASYIPLLGGALAVGQPWPGTYGAVALPDYYARYYDLGPASSYRTYDDVIYRIDPDDAAITAVAALLTGNTIEVGQPMPAGYDVYNVPYRYRDQYYDGPKALYRYSDGTIYQIDPATRLVQAAIELLV